MELVDALLSVGLLTTAYLLSPQGRDLEDITAR